MNTILKIFDKTSIDKNINEIFGEFNYINSIIQEPVDNSSWNASLLFNAK